MIIGITGQARTGKDTFAEVLAEELLNTTGQRYILMAYAQELKNKIQRDFDMSYDQLWGDLKEEVDHRYTKPSISSKDAQPFWTPREIMQAYGQFYRTIDPRFWVRSLFNIIDDKDYSNVIITDIRHPNEAIPVSERGGFVIRIIRNRENKGFVHGQNHISETAMDNYNRIDFEVINDKGLPQLRTSARDVVKFVKSINKL